MESIIGLVRTAVPLTSAQTVSKFNTYLPIIEKVSTLIGMYTFINRAQNYTPLQPLSAKTPMEKVTALISNGNLPIGKILAKPLIANNMDKIISSVAKEVIGPMIKNGNLNEMLSSLQSMGGNKDDSQGNNGNMDISSLLEAFMPLMNNFMSDNSSNSDTSAQNEEETISDSNENVIHNVCEHTTDLPKNANEPTSKIEQTTTDKVNSTPLEIKPRSRRRRYY